MAKADAPCDGQQEEKPPRLVQRGAASLQILILRSRVPLTDPEELTGSARLPLREQPQNDCQGDQSDKTVFAKCLDQRDQIPDDIDLIEQDVSAEQNLKHDEQRYQEKPDLSDLAEPPFYCFQTFRHASLLSDSGQPQAFLIHQLVQLQAYNIFFTTSIKWVLGWKLPVQPLTCDRAMSS
ncbi:MAG: hypothetical protein ACE5KS_10390 [Woeseiaceae bacterium]